MLPLRFLPDQLPFSFSAPAISEASTTPRLLKPTTTTTTTVQQRGQVTTVTTVGTKAVNKTPKSPAAPPQTTTPPPLESFPPPERFCESVELRDILWPQTQRGMLVERPCPKGTRGGYMYLLKPLSTYGSLIYYQSVIFRDGDAQLFSAKLFVDNNDDKHLFLGVI